MPKVGQEPIRRAALVSATIAEIGRAGSLDVTVGQIAKSAGMSTALAHYYFDSKSALFLAAMRQILGDFGVSVRRGLRRAQTPQERLGAIVQASLGQEQFSEHVVSAWLVFYVEAQRSAAAARLLGIYARRLDSNLVHELRQLVSEENARKIAAGAAAMIDGTYLRSAIFARHKADDVASDVAGDATLLVNEYLELMVAAATPSPQSRKLN